MDQENEEATDNDSPGKGLRAQLEQALADKKTLEAELTGLKGKFRQSEVAQILAAKGVNAKIAKFIPADVEGDEAIGKWLDDNADVFGVSAAPEQGSDEPPVAPEVQQSAKRMQSLEQNAQTPGKLADIQARIANAGTEQELNELWAEAQKFML